ncbi:MAG: hypothetical protein ACI4RT_00365 [Candidatus Spyradenecus sp.]
MSSRFSSPCWTLSLLVNAALVLLLMGFSFGGCSAPKEEIIPMEFLVVTEENAADRLAEEPNEAVEPEPEPEPPQPEPPAPDPLPPPPLPDPDPIPMPPPPKPEKKPEPKPEKKPEKKPEPPKPEKKPEKRPEKKPEKKKPVIKIGERVGPVTQGRKDKTKAATQKAPSPEEIRRLLAAGAKPGNKNQIPANEASRCYGLISRAFKEACDRYGLESPPTGRDPILTLTFGPGGTIRSITLKQGSGDRAWDAQALQACRQVRSVEGLSESFLKAQTSADIRLNVR